MDLGNEAIPLLLMPVAVAMLVLLNAFFVAAEFAVVKIRINRLDSLVQEGSFRARLARAAAEHVNATLSACQLGITLTSLGLGWIGEPSISAMLEPLFRRIGLPGGAVHPVSFFLAFSFITALHITVGEQFPKTYAIRKPEQVTLWIALPLVVFGTVMRPFIWLLNHASDWLLRRAGLEPEMSHDGAASEAELRVLMKESHNNGLLDQTEFAMVDNIFDFSETNAREIMIPRTEMICLYAERSFLENMQIAISEMLTRYPVCAPDKDNIIGFVHIKDLLRADTAPSDIRSLIRPLMSVPESMPISSLLRLMQRRRTQMALLIDEYGGTSGLVTVEDILEEIVGEIQDEFDEERPVIERAAGIPDAWSLDGLLLIDTVNEQFNLALESEDYDTIGGWLSSRVEIPPRRGSLVRYGAYELEIEEVEHLRISRILLRLCGDGEMNARQTEAAMRSRFPFPSDTPAWEEERKDEMGNGRVGERAGDGDADRDGDGTVA